MGVLSGDYALRWGAVAAIAAVAAACLVVLGVRFEADSAFPAVEALGLALLVLVALRVGACVVPALGPRTAMGEDFLLSMIQLFVLVKAFLPVTYAAVAASAPFPLLDDVLARLDLALFGAEWERIAGWVAARPVLEQVLVAAYFSLPAQGLVLLVAGSMLRPGERNSEFLWLGIVSMCLTAAVCVFTPAVGKVGHVGTGYLVLFEEIRAGAWTVFTYARAEGIVTFPSFHTTLALVFTYVAWRLHPVLLVVFGPLNLVMLVSIPPIGGHYIVDLFGGAAVALVSVAVVRRIRGAAAAERSPGGRRAAAALRS